MASVGQVSRHERRRVIGLRRPATLHGPTPGADLLTDKQHKNRVTALFADDAHVEVEATWGIYQRMITAYREADRRKERELTTS